MRQHDTILTFIRRQMRVCKLKSLPRSPLFLSLLSLFPSNKGTTRQTSSKSSSERQSIESSCRCASARRDRS